MYRLFINNAKQFFARMRQVGFIILFLGILLVPSALAAQEETLDSLVDIGSDPEPIGPTFKSGNLINAKTVETIHKGELDFRVDHRFGDIAGGQGGVQNFFGLDNAADIRIGFDYGLTDNFNLGIARAKGATDVTQLYEINGKYKLMRQTSDDRLPLTVAAFGSVLASGMSASADPNSPASFRKFEDRLSYVGQLIIARKFSPGISFVVLPTYVHRNYTAFGDQNGLFAIGLGGRIKMSKRMAVVADYFLPFRNSAQNTRFENIRGAELYNALGIGLEIETGGHIFHLNFTNARAIQEAQFIPETISSWGDGQFRWGFSIARRFSLQK